MHLQSLFQALLATLLATAPSLAGALHLDSPLDHQVFQRSTADRGSIQISGEYKDGGEAEIEARLTIGGKADTWRPLDLQWDETHFSGKMEGPAGGWHRLELRVSGDPATTASVAHLGIGEVFVVAGQSNSANHGEEKQSVRSGKVSAWDGEGRWQVAHDPQPGASGGGGSFLPPFADAIADQFDVPVGIVACGIGATSVREWLPQEMTFPNPPTLEGRVRRLPDGQWASDGAAYASLIKRTKALGPQGYRAVLWHQGESDANQSDPTRTLQGDLYAAFLERLIRSTRRDSGWDAPWFVAQASYHVPGDEASPEIRAAQASMWLRHLALQGPDSDAIKGKFRENDGRGVHFSGAGLREHAGRWVDQVAPWLATRLTSDP